jgi:hypothetical protein
MTGGPIDRPDMSEESFDSGSFLERRGWLAPPPEPRKPVFGLRWMFVGMALAAVVFTCAGIGVRGYYVRAEWRQYLESRGGRLMMPGSGVDLTRCSQAQAEECLERLAATPDQVDYVVVRRGQVPQAALDDFTTRTRIEPQLR